MSTITTEQETAIREWLDAHPTLAIGVGTVEQACSVAAINLALTGALTDRVPDCMSEVVGHWIVRVQDAMPASIRNSAAWRDLLPLAAGTGRAHEAERLALVMDWMWETVLPQVQPVADAHGFGAEWHTMCEQRTADAADAAANAAYDAYGAAYYIAAADAKAAAYAADAADAYDAAYDAEAAAEAAANAAANAAYYAAAYAAANAAANAAYYAAAYAAANAAKAADDVWAAIDPVGLLRRLIAVTDARVVA